MCATTEAAGDPADGRRHGVLLYPGGDVYVGQLGRSKKATQSLRCTSGILPGGWAGGSSRRALSIPSTPQTASSCSREGSADDSPTGASAPAPVIDLGSAAAGGPRRRRTFSREWKKAQTAVPRRKGWGVHLHGHEKYEGEWLEDERHGFGSAGGRVGDRYVGCFAQGQRAGGLTVSRTGEVHVEKWEAGELMCRRPVFGPQGSASSRSSSSSSSSSGPKEASVGSAYAVLGQRSATDASAEECSNLRIMDTWSPRQVARLARCLGLGASVAAKVRAHRVDGAAFSTLASPAGVLFLRSIMGESQDGGRAEAKRRLLVLVVEMFLRVRVRLWSPVVSLEQVRERFRDLEIEEGQLTFGDLVGEGGYGHVYRARWMHADVAAKAFRSKNSPDNQPPRDFHAELRVLRELRHPNITLLVGFCCSPKYIIVTEFVSGSSLYNLLHESRHSSDWTLSRVVSVAREVCLGLRYLHAHDVVHCDMKSGNILLSGMREVKICDFGLAHLLGEGGGVSEDAAGIAIGCVGTHNWMAPEVLRGEEYSKAADVYSFGMLVWEMISRRVPFQGYTAVQVIGLVGYGRRRPRTPGGCPESLRSVLRRVLRPRPASRQQVTEVLEVLDRLHLSAVIEVEESLWTFFAG